MPCVLGNISKEIKVGHVTLTIKCDQSSVTVMHMPRHILSLLQVSYYYLENCRRNCGDTNLLCNVYKTNFLIKSRVIIRSEYCDLYAHPLSTSLLWYKFQNITLKIL